MNYDHFKEELSKIDTLSDLVKFVVMNKIHIFKYGLYSLLKAKFRFVLNDLIGKGISSNELLKQFPSDKFYQENIHQLDRLVKNGLTAKRISVIDGWLDLVIYINVKDGKVAGVDSCYFSLDRKYHTNLPIGYSPEEVFKPFALKMV